MEKLKSLFASDVAWFLLLALASFLMMNCGGNIVFDELWHYNIISELSKGVLPYQGISTIVPLGAYAIPALLMAIFGRSLLLLRMFGACVNALIVLVLNRIFGKRLYLTSLVAIILMTYFGYNYEYNQFLVLLLVLIVWLEKQPKTKRNELLIGLLAGRSVPSKLPESPLLVSVCLLDVQKKESWA